MEKIKFIKPNKFKDFNKFETDNNMYRLNLSEEQMRYIFNELLSDTQTLRKKYMAAKSAEETKPIKQALILNLSIQEQIAIKLNI